MKQMAYVYAAWLLFMNLLSFLLMGLDKHRARRGLWRISERTLLGTAALGGAFGGFLGMCLFRHKTRHFRFVLLLPLFTALYFALSVMLFGKGVLHF